MTCLCRKLDVLGQGALPSPLATLFSLDCRASDAWNCRQPPESRVHDRIDGLALLKADTQPRSCSGKDDRQTDRQRGGIKKKQTRRKGPLTGHPRKACSCTRQDTAASGNGLIWWLHAQQKAAGSIQSGRSTTSTSTSTSTADPRQTTSRHSYSTDDSST